MFQEKALMMLKPFLRKDAKASRCAGEFDFLSQEREVEKQVG